MKQVININFQGRVVPIEQTAYEILKQYIASLNKFFANEEGREEIVNDIENRIAELFQQKLKDGSSCITDTDVEAIKRSIGTPEDFGAEAEATENQYRTEGQASGNQNSYTYSDPNAGTGQPRKLYRNENDKVIGGVCSGLANYFGVDVVIMRVIALALFFAGGFGFLTYIILWVIVPSSATQQIGSPRKRLFRDEESKYVGGVCAGIAHYFGIQAWIPRLLFLLPLISFMFKWSRHFGWHNMTAGLNFTPLLVYIILWILIPEAKTTSEKLEMKGEKVDLNSIKNSVVEEMKGFGQRMQNFGTEAGQKISDTAKTMAADVNQASVRNKNAFGNIISTIVKAILYFIAGIIFIILVALLFFLAVASVGLFPLKDYVLTYGWQNLFAWGTLLFFIVAPIVGLITWIIRRVAKLRGGSKYMVSTFVMLWVLGWVCVVFLIASVSKDFNRQSNFATQNVELSNPGVNKLLVTSRNQTEVYTKRKYFKLEPYRWLDEDTVLVKNITINIFKATGDSFYVTKANIARGRTKSYADTAAAKIKFDILQTDSTLLLDKGIAINKTDKFRNQHVIINIFVPVGKQIRIDESLESYNGVYFNNWDVEDRNWDFESENAMKGWRTNVDYIMKADGLYTLDGKAANADDTDNTDYNDVKIDENGIRVKGNGKKITIDENGISIEKSKQDINDAQSVLDSMKQEIRFKEMREKDSLQRQKELIEEKLKKLNTATGLKAQQGATVGLVHSIAGFNPTWML